MRRTAPTLAVLAAFGALALGGCVPANAYNDRDAFAFGNSYYGYPSHGNTSYGNTSYGYPYYGNTSFGYPAFGYPTYGLRRDRDRDRYRDEDRDRRRDRDDHDHDDDHGDHDGDRYRGERPRGFQAGTILRDRDRFAGPVPSRQFQAPPPANRTGAPYPYVQDPSHSHWWGPK